MSEQDAGLARPARTRKELRAAAARAREAATSVDADARALLDAAQDLPAAAPRHPPTRPGGHCERCDAPWPCDTARMQLAEQYGADRVGLSLYMGGRLVQAVRELPPTAPGELFERFVQWTR